MLFMCPQWEKSPKSATPPHPATISRHFHASQAVYSKISIQELQQQLKNPALGLLCPLGVDCLAQMHQQPSPRTPASPRRVLTSSKAPDQPLRECSCPRSLPSLQSPTSDRAAAPDPALPIAVPLRENRKQSLVMLFGTST